MTDFFPERGIVFIVEDQSNDMVNDNQVFFAKRAQDNGKAIESTVFAMAVDRGLCQFDDPVTKHWPEFGEHGKDILTIADVLRHDAGLHAFHTAFSREDVLDQANPDGNMSRIIATQAPWRWASGRYEGQIPRVYHAVS